MCAKFLLFFYFFVCICQAFVIKPQNWNFRGHSIGYEEARRVYDTEEIPIPADYDDEGEPILLLNGFGVGSFHQHRLMEKLLQDRDMSRVVYGVDYLGQGRSWPTDCNDGLSESEQGLIYSGDTWREQVTEFIEKVILAKHPKAKKVHIVGNSVGGHLAVYLAFSRPDLVKSVCLLNPTPVWGLNLPGWSGHLPAPKVPKMIGRFLFDRIRDYSTINQFLKNCYVNREAYLDGLPQKIRECTEGRGGHAAFASILWSPPVRASRDKPLPFYECLSMVDCDVLLVFGKDDPWCRPAFAKKMLQSLSTRQPNKVHRYVELTNVGHCPNHEAPYAVSKLVSSWVSADHRTEEKLALLRNRQEVVNENWGETTLTERQENEISVSILERFAVAFA